MANLTREDATSFFAFVEEAGIHTVTTEFPLDRANEALAMLRDGALTGAAVLVPPVP